MDVLDQCQTVIVQLPKQSIIYDWLFAIHAFYRPIHTYVSIVLCALGAVCNFCNIVVLTRKQMRTPVNMILTAMACCDTVVLFSNLVYTTHYTFVAFANCHPRHWSYGWAMFLIAHAHLSLVGHSSSVWLSVMLAMIRYMTLRRRGKMTGVQIGLKHSYIAIASVILFVSIMNAPNFLTYKIMELGLNETCVITDESVRYASAYVPGVSDMAVEADCLVFRLAFWISGTVFKVLPCLLLTLLVSLLTKILDEVQENRQRLLRGSRTSDPTMPSQNGASAPPSPMPTINDGSIAPDSAHVPNADGDKKQKRSKYAVVVTNSASSPMPINRNNSLKFGARGGRTDRTTRMLLFIVCVFLITELPQGIMAVLSGMFSEEFRRYIYNSMGDILDLLSLCGACTSFIIYCCMSGQFRNEFRRVFIPTRMRKCWASSGASSGPGGDHRFQRSFCSDTNNQVTTCSRSGTVGSAALNTASYLRPGSLTADTNHCNGTGGSSILLTADNRCTQMGNAQKQNHSAADLPLLADQGSAVGLRSNSPYSAHSDCGRMVTTRFEEGDAEKGRSSPYRYRAGTSTPAGGDDLIKEESSFSLDTDKSVQSTRSSITTPTSIKAQNCDRSENGRISSEKFITNSIKGETEFNSGHLDMVNGHDLAPPTANRRQVAFHEVLVTTSDDEDCRNLLTSGDDEDTESDSPVDISLSTPGSKYGESNGKKYTARSDHNGSKWKDTPKMLNGLAISEERYRI
ncbi:serpentine type 7TM GPCR chemoreceptor srw domain-containing protein [Ditylenchus destructor]|nr:serpentine type 7TM GPCR chemoreceptor srw domain-containing protein [Ditylenchus destructor]